jgi:hypothetical protein
MKKGGFDLFLRDLFDACAPRDRFGEKNLQHRGLTTRRQLQDSCKDRDLVDGWISEQDVHHLVPYVVVDILGSYPSIEVASVDGTKTLPVAVKSLEERHLRSSVSDIIADSES